MDPIDSIRTTSCTLIQHGWKFSKYITNRKWTFPLESVFSNGSNGYNWNDFLPPHPRLVNFFQVSHKRIWTFPSEWVHVQWIPSEWLSTPSSNMAELFRSLSWLEHELFHRNRFVSNGLPPLVGLYTSTRPIFRGDTTGIWSTVLENVCSRIACH